MNKFVFYLLSFTWGLLMTIIGLIVALILIIAGYKPEKYGYCLHFKIGNYWGGISLGLVFITDKTPSKHTKNHEHGHSIQNCYWGILFPFVIAIPSVVRYWYRELKYYRKGKAPTTDYDAIWFEGDATKRGTKFIESLGEK
jgi:hypothetical protein